MTPPRHPRYDTLDAWRGLACLLVVLFHATYQLNHELPAPAPNAPVEVALGHLLRPFAHAWVGVPLFFVISGYCIAAADSARRRPLPAGQFFLRRFRRIYPPLWIFLAGTVVLHLLLTRLGAGTGLPLALSLATGWAFHRWVEAKFLNPPVRAVGFDFADFPPPNPKTKSRSQNVPCPPTTYDEFTPSPESLKSTSPPAHSPGQVGV